MRGRGLLVAVVLGALAGVLLVAVVLFVLQRASVGEPLFARRAETGLLLALVLPDSSGNQAARLIVYYPPGGASPVVIDPLTKSVVPGTSANTLGDALTFGGGAELARAYAQLAGVAMPSWVVVDDEAWARINRAGLSVNLPRPVDVFNGSDLISFPAGQVVVQPVDAGTLFAGIHGLSPSARLAILGEAAASLQRDLVSGGTGTGLTSDLSTRRRLKWLSSLATRSLPQTSTP